MLMASHATARPMRLQRLRGRPRMLPQCAGAQGPAVDPRGGDMAGDMAATLADVTARRQGSKVEVLFAS